jgi:uracil-DNA glycosylase family 4
MFSLEISPGNTILPALGNPNSKIAIVGDFANGYDFNAGQPFGGPVRTILEQCLHAAGLILGEVYLTNWVKEKTTNKNLYWNERTKVLTGKGDLCKEALKQELENHQHNVIVAMGPAAFQVLCGKSSLKKFRGYFFESTLLPGKKILPTYHPLQTFHKNYEDRYIIINDLQKAKASCNDPYIHRPDRMLVYNHPNINGVLEWLDYFKKQSVVAFDIEVLNFEVSCISFSNDPMLSCSIPITTQQWTLDEEVLIWRGIQDILGDEKIAKVVQNGLMFDIPFLLRKNGIVTRGPIYDTMLGHSVMFPDLPKGLGFLGSLYCGEQEYWKDMVSFTNVKEES